MNEIEKFIEQGVKDGHITLTPPKGCDLKVGDIVDFTNEYGIVWKGYRVHGFCTNPRGNMEVYAGNSAYWYPKPISSLKKRNGKMGAPGCV